MNLPLPRRASRKALLDATIRVVRVKGLTATRIDGVCVEAGVTKGSFFHHFESKEELALAAAAHWHATTLETFAAGAYHAPSDPLDRLLDYLEFRKALLTGDVADFTCFAGTIIQEA